jgi:predicted TIM-barrel fold metal-dependent hydrolase
MPAAGLDRVPPGRSGAHIASHTIEMMLASLNLIWGGVCDRFPALRFGFLECGGGWMAGWLDRMDRHFDDPVFRSVGGPRTRPSEIFARQCWISFEPVEDSLPYLLEYLGPTKILWATDFPHRDSFVNAPQRITAKIPARHRQSVLAQSAIEFYGMMP